MCDCKITFCDKDGNPKPPPKRAKKGDERCPILKSFKICKDRQMNGPTYCQGCFDELVN